MERGRICFIGASNVEGTGDEERRGWAGRLTILPPAVGKTIGFYNLGVGGDTTDMILSRWRAECEARILPEFEGALIISFGLNDAAEVEGEGLRLPLEQTIRNVTTAATEMKAWKSTIWVGPTPVVEAMMPMNPRPGVVLWHQNSRLSELDATYARIADELDIPYMGIFHQLFTNDDYLRSLQQRDGLHPSGAGYAIMADIIAAWQPWRDLFS